VGDGGSGRRGLVFGLLGAAAIAVVAPFSIFGQRGSYLELDFAAPLALCGTALLAALPRRWIGASEVRRVYGLLLLASAVVTLGFTAQLVSGVAGPAYYKPEVLAQLNPALLLGGKGAAQIRWLYEGLPVGRGVPWIAWARVLLAWAPLVAAWWYLQLALGTRLAQQWRDRERLSFPLAALPLALTSEAHPLLRQGWFWAGAVLPLAGAVAALVHSALPAFPSGQLATTAGAVSLRLSWPMLGFLYFAPQEVLSGLWSINLLAEWASHHWPVSVQANAGPFGAPTDLGRFGGGGAFLALTVAVLWRGRAALSTRTWPLGITAAVALAWLIWSGLPVGAAALLLGLALLLQVGLARVVAEAGVAEAVAPLTAPGLTSVLIGERALGGRGTGAAALALVWAGDLRTSVLAATANGLRVSGAGPRGLAAAGTLAVALGVSLVMTLALVYRAGPSRLEPWWFGPSGFGSQPWAWALSRAGGDTGANLGAVWLMVGGATLAGLLAAARARWLWWPLHPLGLALGGTWIMRELWLTALLAWVAKGLLLRYGGQRAYQAARPWFLGLVLGQYGGAVLGVLVCALLGRTGVNLLWV